MDFQQFIKPELLILVPVLYLIGMALKASKAPDKFIPLTLGIFGAVLSLLWVLSTSPISGFTAIMAALFSAITQGVLAAGASVYANQMLKQLTQDDENGEDQK